jgi:translation initiation factor 2 subunit 3
MKSKTLSQMTDVVIKEFDEKSNKEFDEKSNKEFDEKSNKEFDLLEIQKLQPIMNIGTIGHVSHGKSTIVKQTSGKTPQQFSSEQVRNITIQLGYANVKIFQCVPCDLYQTQPGSVDNFYCTKCCKITELRLHFSYVDSPGHQSYMSTMLNGTAVMDGILLVIGSNEPIPQPQTAEHMIAAELMDIKNGIVVLNKLDLMSKSEAQDAYVSTKKFLKNSKFENSPIIPLCANYGINLDVLAKTICQTFPIPQKNLKISPRMVIIRSFDVSKAGEPAKEVKGGVAGGSLLQGVIRVGQQVEIRPGLIFQQKNPDTGLNEFLYKPVKTIVTSLFSEKTPLQFAIPGGLIGVGTKLDPALTKQNRLVGQIIGLDLPDVYDEIKLKYNLIAAFNNSNESPFKKGDKILLNVHSSEIPSTVAIIPKKQKDIIIVVLSKPVCIDTYEKVSISKAVDGRWRLCGYAVVQQGKPITRLE